MLATINRRGFLRQSATLAPVAVGAHYARADGQRVPVRVPTPRRGPNDEIRVAVIGLGNQGARHGPWHEKGTNIRVVTVCDVDENRFQRGTSQPARKPKTEFDLRRILDDQDVDCVSIATCNHWHALATIWAGQAGKDVYVEKPVAHNIIEGRKMIEAARKYERIVQYGVQGRSSPGIAEGLQHLRAGLIGEIYMARVIFFSNRESIGTFPDEPAPPPGVHYDLWLGPAPVRPFNKNRLHYEWHWNWDYGNGEMGNNGPHGVDLALRGLGKQTVHPVQVYSTGGRYTYQDQGQTPNTQTASLKYADGTMLVIDVRGRPSNTEWDCKDGALFYGPKGYMHIGLAGNYKSVVDGQPGPARGRDQGDDIRIRHIANFHHAVRSRNLADLAAPIEHGHYSTAVCHLANISYRLGRALVFDPQKEVFPGDDEANKLLTRGYREPFVVPEQI